MESRKQSFVKGAAILAAAGVITKILGAIYRIPIGNIISSEGMGYYQTAYDVYAWALILSAYAIPTAISKLTSEKYEIGRADEAHRIFRVALVLMLVLGLVMSVIMMVYSEFFAILFNNPGASLAILYVAPSIFLFSISGAFRGYFQGMQNMTPSAISQIGEQLGRVVFGFILAIVFIPMGYKAAAGGTIIGTTIGGLFSVLILIYVYFKNRHRIKIDADSTGGHRESSLAILKHIVAFSIPIAIGGSIIPIMSLLDSLIVMDRLQAAGYIYEDAVSLLGQLKGMAGSFINLPQVLTVSLAASLVPAISESLARRDFESIKKKSELGIRLSIIIGFPSAMGLTILAKPIMLLMFPKEAESLGLALMYLAPSVVFLTLFQALTAILQGMGKVRIPLINLAVCAIAKIFATYYLTSIPGLNIRGAAIGTVVGYAIACILNMLVILNTIKGMNFNRMFVKPFIATTAMSITAYFAYSLVFNAIGRNSIATLASMFIAAAVYGIVLIAIKGITIEELQLAPGGNKLSRMLRRKGIK
ncbi:MAG: putative polysaccharide biosynthesis protein [Bacillota bacterium]